MEDTYKSLVDHAFSEIQAENNQLKRVNLLVTGKSGVGKSTLINTVFGDELAKTGIGKPVTDKIQLIEQEGFPVHIYDTVGFELEKFGFDFKGLMKSFTKNDIQKLIVDLQKTETPDDDIHVIWYLISGTSARIEEAEIDFINWLVDQRLPVVVALTKSYDVYEAELLKTEIIKLAPRVQDVVVLLAKSTSSLEVFGVEELINTTFTLLPTGLQASFVHSQEASLLLKRQEASKIVRMTMASSLGQNFSISDANFVKNQTNMMAEVTSLYGVGLSEAQLTTIIDSLLKFYEKIISGKNIAEKLSNILPGIGKKISVTFISGMIDMLLVAAIGFAYIGLMEILSKQEIDINTIQSNELSEMLINLLPKYLPH